jgi:NADPH:quinone reductase-like Zn-dependent oxidoreductase
MKAITWTKYGPPEVLQLCEVKKPIPKPNEVLIKIRATTVTAGDCELRRFEIARWIWIPLRLYMGIFKPRIRILGQELAGEIEAIGSKVSQFKPGDSIFAPTQMSFGAYAQYICLPADYTISARPANISYEEAATIPTGGLNALHFVRKANIQAGQHLLINGAGGSIGTYAIQLAKLLGAEVTAVDSAKKLETLKSIGADHVIDYTKTDFSKTGIQYDAIIDIVGKRTFSRCVKALKKNGICIMGNPRFSGLVRGLWISKTSGKKVVPAMADYKTENLNYLRALMASGKLRSVIDKRYSLEEITEAHSYVERGDKIGNLVIMIDHSSNR